MLPFRPCARQFVLTQRIPAPGIRSDRSCAFEAMRRAARPHSRKEQKSEGARKLNRPECSARRERSFKLLRCELFQRTRRICIARPQPECLSELSFGILRPSCGSKPLTEVIVSFVVIGFELHRALEQGQSFRRFIQHKQSRTQIAHCSCVFWLKSQRLAK